MPLYLSILANELEARRARNPSYSLRAFARDLDMPVSRLSGILRGLQGISPDNAVKICRNLNLKKSDQRLFFASLEDSPESRPVVSPPDLGAEEYADFMRATRWCPIFRSLRFLKGLLAHLEPELAEENPKC